MQRLIAPLLGTTFLASAALAGPQTLTPDEARHLLVRTGFGAAPHEISSLTGTSRAQAVDDILSGLRRTPATPMPDWSTGWAYPFAQIEALGQGATELFYANRYGEMEALQRWWIGEMLATPSPLTERLTLFWHDHFATSFEAHENPQWTAQNNQMLRAHAAGNFADLAAGILRDPSMLVYLTNTENNAEAPNENLAREFLELFTLGEGRGYTETDVTEAARALTGHTIDEFGSGQHMLSAEAHDFGQKTVLGQTGDLDAPDLPAIVMADPNFGPYIVEKLWLTFVSDQPDPAEVTRLTGIWREAGWEIQPLLRALFLSDAFWAPDSKGRLVKSPVELIVGTARTFGMPIPNSEEVNWAIDEMGQSLFLPPNVAGWPTGAAWITNAAAGSRATVMDAMMELAEDPLEPWPPQSSAGFTAAAVGPQDLRVGQVFAMEAEAFEDGGTGVLLSLFDVSLGGREMRSISIWLEVWRGEGLFAALHTGDCGPTCLDGLEKEEGWALIEPEDGLRRALRDVSPEDLALLQAVLGHLPALLDRTEGQMAWTAPYEDDEITPATFREVRRDAAWVARIAQRALGAPEGQIVDGFSYPDALGLNRPVQMAMMMTEADLDAYFEETEDQDAAPLVPQVTYAGLDDWLAALPGQGPLAERAEAVLLALPRHASASASAMDRPADDLLRDILLSPHYQLK